MDCQEQEHRNSGRASKDRTFHCHQKDKEISQVQQDQGGPGTQIQTWGTARTQGSSYTYKGTLGLQEGKMEGGGRGELWLRYTGWGWGKGPGAAERQELQTEMHIRPRLHLQRVV